ncbi:MAG: zinc-binding alcohol dehydrogenase [Clostridia bacterium]|nr:zinc-binding alcohol dehydrogenase [Clostridia bacterium]
MEIKQIVFTKKDTAELLTKTGTCGDNEVCVKTAFSTVSCGTERANITGDPNVSIGAPGEAFFPRYLGYSSSGVVTEIGKNVTSVKVGDRVAMFSSTHSSYNILPEYYVVKIEDDRVSLAEAAMSYIAIFPLAAIRKTRLEIGESCLVMGLGILGQLAVQEARAAGAVPIIACDLVAERREEALKNGADYALNPAEEGFAEKVKELTGGGVNVCIEVTGVGQGFDQALDCMARFGRVALLGCTRDKNFTIDYYRKIHGPGITVVGAHTMARPVYESSAGWFTAVDDIKAVLRLAGANRLNLKSMIAETHKPEDCPSVYTRLVNDRNFPPIVQFDWSE